MSKGYCLQDFVAALRIGSRLERLRWSGYTVLSTVGDHLPQRKCLQIADQSRVAARTHDAGCGEADGERGVKWACGRLIQWAYAREEGWCH